MASCASKSRQSILLFLFIFGGLQFSIMGLSSIFRSTLTFVEKQFQINSKTSGLITSGNELVSLILILPVTYFGCRFHRPFCIAVGGLIVAVGYACLGLPHFFMASLDIGDAPTNRSASNVSFELCSLDSESLLSNSSSTTSSPPSTSIPKDTGEPNRLWLVLFLAQIGVGVGASHIYSYGASYIDDHADKAKSPLFFGILMSLNLLGPGFGHVVGAWASTVYVDADRTHPTIKNDDPRWVGAWWLGPLLMSVVVAIGSSSLFIFPKRMNTEYEEDLSSLVTEGVDHFTINDGGDTKKKLVQLPFSTFVKAFPQVAWRLLKNPVFSLSCLCFGFVMALVASLAVFQPKYMQEEFGITSAHANFLIGAVKMPFGIVGTLSGGAIMGRLKLNLRGASIMVFVVALLCAGCIVFNFFIGCKTRPVAGITAGLNQSCVSECGCLSGTFAPVCGADGVEYLSPCQAGCKFENHESHNSTFAAKKFTDCRCLQFDTSYDFNIVETETASPNQFSGLRGATSGNCKNRDCIKKVYTYVAIGTLNMFLSGLLQAPTIMILLRSIAVEDKSFGLGIMMLAGRLMGWIPMPPLTGALIDSTCLSWTDAGAKKGACRLYDSTSLRNHFWGLLTGLDLTVLFLFGLIALYVQVKKFDGHPENEKKSAI